MRVEEKGLIGGMQNTRGRAGWYRAEQACSTGVALAGVEESEAVPQRSDGKMVPLLWMAHRGERSPANRLQHGHAGSERAD